MCDNNIDSKCFNILYLSSTCLGVVLESMEVGRLTDFQFLQFQYSLLVLVWTMSCPHYLSLIQRSLHPKDMAISYRFKADYGDIRTNTFLVCFTR